MCRCALVSAKWWWWWWWCAAENAGSTYTERARATAIFPVPLRGERVRDYFRFRGQAGFRFFVVRCFSSSCVVVYVCVCVYIRLYIIFLLPLLLLLLLMSFHSSHFSCPLPFLVPSLRTLARFFSHTVRSFRSFSCCPFFCWYCHAAFIIFSSQMFCLFFVLVGFHVLIGRFMLRNPPPS